MEQGGHPCRGVVPHRVGVRVCAGYWCWGAARVEKLEPVQGYRRDMVAAVAEGRVSESEPDGKGVRAWR